MKNVSSIEERMPLFEGCDRHKKPAKQEECTLSEIADFIAENTVYPQKAIDLGISGTVNIYYEISKDGFVEKVRVLEPVQEMLDNEAIRVVKTLPPFTPGFQKGKNVRVAYTLPVKFKLE